MIIYFYVILEVQIFFRQKLKLTFVLRCFSTTFMKIIDIFSFGILPGRSCLLPVAGS